MPWAKGKILHSKRAAGRFAGAVLAAAVCFGLFGFASLERDRYGAFAAEESGTSQDIAALSASTIGVDMYAALDSIANTRAAAEAEAAAASDTADATDATDYSALVPELVQYPEMSAGCEVYSLTSVLQALGYDADPHEIANEYLPYASEGGSPEEVFNGNPYVVGWGFPPAMVIAGNDYLADQGSDAAFEDATGTPFDLLVAEADAGHPVLVWTTMYFQEPGFATPLASYTIYTLEHCAVILGSNDEGVQVMDPMTGMRTIDYDWMEYLYRMCGTMAVTVEP